MSYIWKSGVIWMMLCLFAVTGLQAQVRVPKEKAKTTRQEPERQAADHDAETETEEEQDDDFDEEEEDDTEDTAAKDLQQPEEQKAPPAGRRKRRQAEQQTQDTAVAEEAAVTADTLQETAIETDVRKAAVLQLYDSCMRNRNYPQAYLHIKYLERFSYDNIPEMLFYKIKCLIYIADYSQPNSGFVQEIRKSISTLQEMQQERYQFSRSVDMDWIAKIQMNYFMEGPLYTKWLNDPEYKKAQQLFDKKSFEKAAEYFTLSTSHNNGLAYYYLGIMYELGLGVPKDLETANTYFEIASESHIGLAHWSLAKNLLAEGNKTLEWSELNTTEKELYLKHMKEAALLNVNQAKYALGMYYLYDEKELPRQERNYLAYDWFVNAAKDGNIDAQLKLAEMHCKGIGTIVSHQEASYWIKLAAASQQVSQQKIVELQDCIKDL